MLEAPSKEHLPAHSRDVCPWGLTCPVHARPTFADERRTATIKARHARKPRALKPCSKCGTRRTVANLTAYARGTGRRLSVCPKCLPDPTMARVPKWLTRAGRQAVAA